MPLTVRGKMASPTSPTGSVDSARMLDTARYWAEECRWHEHRQHRLERERDQLELWLTRNDATNDDRLYRRRAHRSSICFRMARHHQAEIDRVSDLLYTIIARQPADLQGKMTSIWFASKTQPPPRVRPTKGEWSG